jgi:hypothetical protein
MHIGADSRRSRCSPYRCLRAAWAVGEPRVPPSPATRVDRRLSRPCPTRDRWPSRWPFPGPRPPSAPSEKHLAPGEQLGRFGIEHELQAHAVALFVPGHRHPRPSGGVRHLADQLHARDTRGQLRRPQLRRGHPVIDGWHLLPPVPISARPGGHCVDRSEMIVWGSVGRDLPDAPRERVTDVPGSNTGGIPRRPRPGSTRRVRCGRGQETSSPQVLGLGRAWGRRPTGERRGKGTRVWRRFQPVRVHSS